MTEAWRLVGLHADIIVHVEHCPSVGPDDKAASYVWAGAEHKAQDMVSYGCCRSRNNRTTHHSDMSVVRLHPPIRPQFHSRRVPSFKDALHQKRRVQKSET